MTASLLDGKYVASQRLETLKNNIQAFIASGKPTPCLAVILIGNDPASQIYVNHKRRASLNVGLKSKIYELPATASESELLKLIHTLNQNNSITGILVQLPLPKHINPHTVIEHIDPKKDVDGFHPYNLGRLAQGNPALKPCTPYGMLKLLEHYNLHPHGKNAVVIGRSNIVGRPMALELLLADATVTICHRATQNLESHIKHAEILIVAAGAKDIISNHWFQKNHIVLDVGIHRESDGTLRGDVDFHQVKDKVAWITPVPGGVGPMTISTLLENTFEAAKSAD